MRLGIDLGTGSVKARLFDEDGSTLGMGGDHRQNRGSGPEMRGQMGTGMGMAMAQIESELDFLTHMIPHHREAIDSSRHLLEVAEREEVRELARGIIDNADPGARDDAGLAPGYRPSAEITQVVPPGNRYTIALDADGTPSLLHLMEFFPRGAL